MGDFVKVKTTVIITDLDGKEHLFSTTSKITVNAHLILKEEIILKRLKQDSNTIIKEIENSVPPGFKEIYE
jgi:hypothetical protein